MPIPLKPPVEFTLACSDASLGDLELATLNRASHLRRQLAASLDELIKLEAEALFLRWMIEHRAELVDEARAGIVQIRLDFLGSPRR